MTLNEDSDIDVELKERYGSPDGQDVSIDGMNILLFYELSWYFRRKQGRIQECLIGGGGGVQTLVQKGLLNLFVANYSPTPSPTSRSCTL